jgi:uncharacterized protein (TIGR00369 family)
MDPTANEGVSAFSGLKYFRALIEGSIARSAMLELFDINIEAAEPGLVVLTAIPTAEHYNPLGFVHGGYAAVLLDTCMAAAIVTSLEPGLSPVTLEYKINISQDRCPPIQGSSAARARRYMSVGRWPSAKADCSTRTAGFSPTERPPAMSCGKRFPKGCLYSGRPSLKLRPSYQSDLRTRPQAKRLAGWPAPHLLLIKLDLGHHRRIARCP